MNFDESVDYLYQLGHETLTMKLGLQNTQILLAACDNPQRFFLKIQIVGTNGKGSVCAFLNSICRAANLRTGLYTSPHLILITERIRINGAEISENHFARFATLVRETSENLVKTGKLKALPTFFEYLTVIALLSFREASVDVAILETGLGGRLDSTTAAAAEIIGITPISLDHQEYLGRTIKDIAAEKAAVVKPNTRVCIAHQEYQEAMQEILRQCDFNNVVPQVEVCQFEIENATVDGRFTATFKTENNVYRNVRLSLRGEHQIENAALAVGLAESLAKKRNDAGFAISPTAVIKGLQNAAHAGRLELWEASVPPILFDGAHNIAGAKALRKFLREFYAETTITIIFGSMRDKDWAEIAVELFPLAANLILTRPDNPRSAAPKDLEALALHHSSNIVLAPNVRDALQTAQKITVQNGLICLTGSLYLIGEAQRILIY